MSHISYFGRAVRPGWFARIAFGALIAGSAGSVVAEALLRFDWTAGNNLYSVVGSVHAAGFILAGIGVIRARAWTSWHRFMPLAMGLYVPLLMIPLLARSNGTSPVALAGFHVGILLVGLAFWRESAN